MPLACPSAQNFYSGEFAILQNHSTEQCVEFNFTMQILRIAQLAETAVGIGSPGV